MSMKVDEMTSVVKFVLDALQMTSFIKWDRFRDGRRNWLWEMPVADTK